MYMVPVAYLSLETDLFFQIYILYYIITDTYPQEGSIKSGL